MLITRKFIDVPAGTIHLAMAGSGRPVLLLHQTPRSWDEFRDVLPLLGKHYKAIAMDTIGFGDSSKPPLGNDSIKNWAKVVISVLDALGIYRVSVVGHRTGGIIATELAANYPDRIEAAVLFAMPLIDAAFRASHKGPPPVDNVTPQPDGSHLTKLWSLRQPWYPPGNTDLLERLVVDAVKAGPRAAEGHLVAWRYVMETQLPKIRCPVLVAAPDKDPHTYPFARKLAACISGSKVIDIPGGMVPLPDQMPEEFARVVIEFLENL
jgi:pimeloyl-ACP methyl ester carboxylesterase